MKTRRLTTAQALVQFLIQQHSRRDGVTRRFVPKMLGIFGHGNVAGLGEALLAAQKNGWLTPDVLALVRRESETVRADGDADLAEGLEVLAEHIAGMLAVAQA